MSEVNRTSVHTFTHSRASTVAAAVAARALTVVRHITRGPPTLGS